jgi:hypothetical protein
MYDLTLLTLKFSIVFSPLVFLVSYFVPALLADGYFFAFYLNVEFDVFVFAGVFPRVFTMLHFSYLSISVLAFCAFKAVAETTVWSSGGVS